ncbi:DUF2478 domain-containing protein [Oricola nitratireducens]|uniref:DUF2478 domain-containing protein n=1 Tax=Oricola nitratireducens TaxID=2775868 RepID=UPI001865A68C|nr:DUF2478 domain-containing protein [Oricola nitratireducens]
MLGYVTSDERGAVDRLLTEAARVLSEQGWPLAGVVQENFEDASGGPCDMVLHVLATDRAIRISQNLGAMAQGCRLDPVGLEQAAGLVEGVLNGADGVRPRLLIINKFGKQEIEGRGFRPLIGRALSEDIPVLTAVNALNMRSFQDFAAGMGRPIEPSLGEILDWAKATSPA